MATNKTSLLESLFRRHADELRHLAHRHAGAHAANDLVQEVYLRLLRHANPDGIDNPRAYLQRTAVNPSINCTARERVRAKYTEADIDFENVASPAPGPEEIVDSRWRFERFLAVLDDLPQACRDAFVLNKIEGLTHAQIAHGLGVSEKTVQRYILQALEYCETRLGE